MAKKNDTPPATDSSDPLFGGTPAPAAPEPSKALVPQAEIAPGTFASPSQSAIARRGFGEEIETSNESGAVAAQVRAQIAARTLHAMQHPRSFAAARIAILDDCRRPAFAKAAIYRKPVAGSHIEGLSIRFAESALRHWGNVYTQAMVTFDSEDKRQLNIFCSDLETNTTHAHDVVLLKRVEKKKLREGQKPISERVNSYGEVVYEVRATEDELQTKQGAARSKVMRNEGLRLIPADILDEALALCRETRGKADKDDPAQARRDIMDGFNEIGVKPVRIEEFLGCPLDECSPAQLGELREVYRAVKDGDATMMEFIEARASDLQGDDTAPSKVRSITEQAKANAAARKAKA